MGAPGAAMSICGLAAREVERAYGYRSMMSVQSSLVMHAIHAYGSETQRRKYLPGSPRENGSAVLASPNQMPDPTRKPCAPRRSVPRMDTGSRAPKPGSPIAQSPTYSCSGQNRARVKTRSGDFFSNAGCKVYYSDTSDFAKAFAARRADRRDRHGRRRGPGGQLLPDASGLKGPFGCVNHARYGICWGGMGAAEACFEAGRTYTRTPAARAAACRVATYSNKKP